MRFRDHHRFTAADVQRISAAARTAGAIIVTTEKDAVRLERCALNDVAIAVLPLLVDVEPATEFAEWLRERIATARTKHPARGTQHPAPGTQHPAPGTKHPARGAEHPVPGTKHPASCKCTLHPAPCKCTLHPAACKCTLHPAPCTLHPEVC
jgi:hypothetical protein